jgi:hypothetical protein
MCCGIVIYPLHLASTAALPLKANLAIRPIRPVLFKYLFELLDSPVQGKKCQLLSALSQAINILQSRHVFHHAAC